MKHSEVTQTDIIWLSLNPELLKERERFWSKVNVSSDENVCWEWTKGLYKRSTKGLFYGAFSSSFFGNNVVAHRMAFLFTKGFIPLGNHVHLRHLCNNGKCCNPSHLALGTASDNVADKVVAGTIPRGDSHYLKSEPWRHHHGKRMPKVKVAKRIGKPPTDPKVRFWKYVNKETGCECWEWTGRIQIPPRMPYGRFPLNDKTIIAHRFSYQMHFGEIPTGMLVCHSCGNHRCVNPSHLCLRTSAENNRITAEKELLRRSK